MPWGLVISIMDKVKNMEERLWYSEKALERNIEDALVSNITNLLLEFGNGFAFVGRQYHLEIEGEDYYIDLLFYNLNLKCYVVVELKTVKFTPEFAGKLKNAIDIAKNNPNLLVADYPRDMLDTRTDEELVESINSKENDKLEYLGAVIYGDTKEVDEITGKFQLWRID